MFSYLRKLLGAEYGVLRSSGWGRVRANWIKNNPKCLACGTIHNLDVHHIKPYHLFPELELDTANLVTLCRTHHYQIGHFKDWRKYNIDVVVDSILFFQRI
jgi:hypothetical protein